MSAFAEQITLAYGWMTQPRAIDTVPTTSDSANTTAECSIRTDIVPFLALTYENERNKMDENNRKQPKNKNAELKYKTMTTSECMANPKLINTKVLYLDHVGSITRINRLVQHRKHSQAHTSGSTTETKSTDKVFIPPHRIHKIASTFHSAQCVRSTQLTRASSASISFS
jgi:hypothetical protein